MTIDLAILQPYIDKRLISAQKHPECDYVIYNYTQKAQFEKAWDKVTKMCRGLILDSKGTVIARPFDKFFNLEEIPAPSPWESFTIWDKLDGSLGILYHMPDGELRLATRGSFTSEQAIEGTAMLHEALKDSTIVFDPRFTYLFEILYPANRIVVDYHGERKLVYLGARNIETGVINPPSIPYMPFEFEIAKQFTMDDLKKPRENAEGFVYHYKSGLMAKVKYDEYKRLHRLVTGVNAKTIWELLRARQPIDELLERVPDEFYQWVIDTKKKLDDQYEALLKEVLFAYMKITTELVMRYGDGTPEWRPERKAFALLAITHPHSGILFALYDKKPIDAEIWKLVRPEAKKPFREDL
jgi:RNA ligase